MQLKSWIITLGLFALSAPAWASSPCDSDHSVFIRYNCSSTPEEGVSIISTTTKTTLISGLNTENECERVNPDLQIEEIKELSVGPRAAGGVCGGKSTQTDSSRKLVAKVSYRGACGSDSVLMICTESKTEFSKNRSS